MSWFGSDEGRHIADVLAEVAAREPDGVVAVVGRGSSGTVWFAGGRVAFAHTDQQPELRRALQLTGIVDALELASLARSASAPATERPEVTPDVVTVAETITDDALAQLLDLPEGNVQLRPTELPPFGVLSSRSLDEVLAAARARRVRARLDALGTVGAWQLRPATDDAVTLSANEWNVVRAMTRRTRADELAETTGRAYDQVRTLLAALSERGLADRTPANWAEHEPAAPLAERARPRATPPPPAPTGPPTSPAAEEARRQLGALSDDGPSALDLALSASRTAGPARAPRAAASTDDDGRVERPGRAAALRRLIGAVRTG